MTIAAFGELLWDLLPTGAVLGGAPANFAVRLQSLGWPVELLTAVGRDELGEQAVAEIQRRGVAVSALQYAPKPTGTVEVLLDEGGTPEFVIRTGAAYDCIALTPELKALAAQCQVLYFGTLAQRASVSRETLAVLLNEAKQAIKFLDLNLRAGCYSPETVRASVSQADVVKLNEQELLVAAKILGLEPFPLETFARGVIDRFTLRVCIVTLGAKGVFAADDQGHVAHVSGLKVKVADLVGAGDACAAGFVHGLLRGWSLAQCAEHGNLLGAATAAKAGGMPEITPEELKKEW